MDADELLSRYRAGQRNFRRAELLAADLRGANLRGADFHGADLGESNLAGADLQNAHFGDANLVAANLRGADLRAAHLTDATLVGADLRAADLSKANLVAANFSRANLKGAKFDGVALGLTLLVDTDLGSLIDADGVEHDLPCTVDHRSILLSLGSPGLKAFLRKCGMPEIFVEYNVDCAAAINGSIIHKMLRSTFISYGQPDAPFARKLYEALHRNGVTTFFFEVHAEPGKKLHKVMRDGVNDHDRTVLICSKGSLDRSGVQNEIEQVLAREARNRGESFMIPIRLDDFLFDEWKPSRPELKQEICDRVVADFRGADTDPAKFDAALQRLIGALKI